MEFTSDVLLKGSNWKKAIDGLQPFLDKSMQPNYAVYVIAVSIGIMYDKQSDIAGTLENVNDDSLTVPRTVLHNHSSDIEFLFQTAILTSSLTDLEKKQKMDLAFNSSSKIEFKKMEFLTKFANFGVGVILEQISDNAIETMDNIKEFIVRTFEGKNYSVYGISDDDLDINDLDN